MVVGELHHSLPVAKQALEDEMHLQAKVLTDEVVPFGESLRDLLLATELHPPGRRGSGVDRPEWRGSAVANRAGRSASRAE